MEEICRCPLRPNMTYDELMDEIVTPQKNCCHPHWICNTLRIELDRADTDRQRRKQYNKRLKRQGFSDEEIKNRPIKKKAKGTVDHTILNLEVL